MVIIRLASITDAKSFLPLISQLGYPLSLEILTERLTHFTTQPNHYVYAAEVNNQIVGFIAGVFYEIFILDGRKARIEGLVVDKQYRGKGIGTELIKTVETLAKEKDCLVIELTSGLRRALEGTHEFYKKLGYHNDGYMAKLYLRKELKNVNYQTKLP